MWHASMPFEYSVYSRDAKENIISSDEHIKGYCPLKGVQHLLGRRLIGYDIRRDAHCHPVHLVVRMRTTLCNVRSD